MTAFAVCILLGSAAGGMARFWLSTAVGRRFGGAFPWGTFAVNLSGAALIGGLAGWLSVQPGPVTQLAWAALAAGFLGSYTTVSTFSLQTLRLVHERRWRLAAGNVALSACACFTAAAAGLLLARRLSGE